MISTILTAAAAALDRAFGGLWLGRHVATDPAPETQDDFTVAMRRWSAMLDDTEGRGK